MSLASLDEGDCPSVPDGTHCYCWWDAEGACCYCRHNTPAMPPHTAEDSQECPCTKEDE